MKMQNTVTITNDQDLLQKLRSGNRAAFATFGTTFRPFLVSVAYQALQNSDDAQDIAQEVLIYAYHHVGELRDRAKLRAWLRQVTFTLCAEYRRRRGTRRLGEPIALMNEESEEANYAEQLLLRQALAHLPEAQRTAFLMHYSGGWGHEEVAQLLNIPVSTVRSRLQAAKKALRTDLHALYTEKTNTMSANTLTQLQTSLLYSALPDAKILSVQSEPEAWMPFFLRLVVESGETRTVEFRNDITPEKAELLPSLIRCGIPGPRLLTRPIKDGDGFITLAEGVRGENLLLWAMGGTPHRLRLAADRGIEAITILHNATEALQNDPMGKRIARRTLADEVASIKTTGGDWLQEAWFTDALAKVEAATVPFANAPLVYTDYLHYFPNVVRVAEGGSAMNEPMGWPGDAQLAEKPIVEFVSPFGHFGDPLLGLAMVWIYDCYPIVHAGFVEKYLFEKGISRREFAPRLALRALQTIQRELPTVRPTDGPDYWDALHGYVEQGVQWL